MNKQKNSYIELLRIIFAIIVVLHHTFQSYQIDGLFYWGGYIAVEFFFVITGYMTVAHIEKASDRSDVECFALSYSWSKIRPLIGLVALSLVIDGIINYQVYLSSEESLFNYLYGSFASMMCISMTGITNMLVNSPLWYLSVIIITLPLFIIFTMRFRKFFKYYGYIFLPLLIHGYLLHYNGSIAYGWASLNTPIDPYLLRGFGDILLGGFVYDFSVYLRSNKKLNSKLLAILELTLLCFALYLINRIYNSYAMECAVLMIVVSLSISFSGKTLTNLFKNSFVNNLGRMSFGIYCLHFPILSMVKKYFPEWSWEVLPLVLIISLIIYSLYLLLIHIANIVTKNN